MPDNDLLLLDSLVQKSRNQYGTRQDESEYFELFSIDNVLKNFDCSLEQLEEGWVDGGDDGGIDGFYVFIDGISLSEQLDLKRVRSEPIIEIYILTVKLGETFRQTALTLLLGTLVDLFDLRNANLANPYFEPLVELRQRFRKTYIELADKNPSMRINIVYCSRGDSKKIAKNVQ